MLNLVRCDGRREYEVIAALTARTVQTAAEERVKEIIADIRERGDAALVEYTERFDGVSEIKRIGASELKGYYDACDAPFREGMERAAANIRMYHEKQLRSGYRIEKEGILLGQVVRPLKRVGVYVPGGTAAYPSSVLMNVIPAKIAGVGEIVMATPPAKNDAEARDVLAAAYIAGVDEVLFAGGAQVVAALAYGTERIARVDKIVGPGNMYVAAAKKLCYGVCDIDMIAGPSEILVVADETADARFVAADLMSQAEHDEMASAVLVCASEAFARAVDGEIVRQSARLPRKDIIEKSIARYGYAFIAEDAEKTAEIVNLISPEHLELCIADAERQLPRFDCAGSVFLGNYSPEPLGDYYAGTNHVLPTSGTARFASPLGVDNFVKKYSYLSYDAPRLADAAEDIMLIARRERLTAHENAVAVRLEKR